MSFFRERTHLLTGPVLTLLALMFLLNLGLPSLTLSKSHIAIVNGDAGGSGDGKPDEWVSPRPGYQLDIANTQPNPSFSFISLFGQFLLRTLMSWF
jgi:hypothetical protein